MTLTKYSKAEDQARFMEAVDRLRNQNEFQEFINWLRFNLSQEDQDNRIEPDEALMRQRQGRSQVLSAIVEEPLFQRKTNF